VFSSYFSSPSYDALSFYFFSSFCLTASPSSFLKNSSPEEFESEFDERSIEAGNTGLPGGA